MLVKMEGKRRRGRQRMRWLDGITDSMDMGVGGLQNLKKREDWRAVVHGVTKSWTRLSNWTELNWTELNQVRRHLINLLNEHESIFSFLSTSDFSISLVQTSAASVPWKCGGRSKRKLAPFPLYFLSLGSTSNALKLCNYKKMGNATEKKAVDLVWFRALAIRLVCRIIMTQNAEISI